MYENQVVKAVNISISPLQRTFHPILRLHIAVPPSSRPDSGSLCRAVLRLDLPDAVFVDPDELEGRWGPRSLFDAGVDARSVEGSGNGGGGVRWDVRPAVIDIERPVRVSHDRAREALKGEDVCKEPGEAAGSCLWLSVPIDAHDEGVDELECESIGVDMDIPIHGRYLRPVDSGIANIMLFGDMASDDKEIGQLRGGLICEPPGRDGGVWEEQSFDLGNIPLPIVHLRTPATLTLPTGHPAHQLPVELITAIVIWLGWAYLVRKLVRALSRHRQVVSKATWRGTPKQKIKVAER